jgi:phosphatidylglycerophosphatase A
LAALLLIFVYSFYAVSEYIKDSKNKDPKEVVVDEFIGQSIPIYLYEIAHGSTKSPQEAVLFYLYIFILFRYFDIKKPFPVSYFDKKFKNSFGVILDDVMAGFYVVITLIIFMVIKSKFFSWT